MEKPPIPFWAITIDESEYVDGLFIALGRLLFKAQSFERLCKAAIVAHNIAIDPNAVLNNDQALRTFAKNIEQKSLGNHIGTTANPIFNSQYIWQVLDAAKKARNRVAHDITISLEDILGHLEKEKKLEMEVVSIAQAIVKGEHLCILLVALFTNDFIPDKSYIDRTVRWITSPILRVS